MTDTWTVTEGAAHLEVPVASRHSGAQGSPGKAESPTREGEKAASGPPRGPGKVEGGLFFNPAMRFSRDLSVLFIEERAASVPSDHPYTVFDGLAATGARGIRLALECRPGRRLWVHLNDRDAGAVALLHRNIRANDVSDRVEATCEDFVQALGTRRYDHVDVDPFGSPVPFLDGSVQHVRDRGSIALTATDVTALCGLYPKVARRRYGAVPWHGPAMHEVALRILAGTAVRDAARHDVALTPVLAHATDHYVRVYLTARKGATRADAALSRLGHAVEAADGTRRLVAGVPAVAPSEARRFAGPLWTGSLQDGDLCRALTLRLKAHPVLDARPLERFLGRAGEEADAAPLFYEIGEVAKRLGVSPPPMEGLFAALRDAGHTAHRTHVSDTGFKTDAPGPAIDAAFRAAVASVTDP